MRLKYTEETAKEIALLFSRRVDFQRERRGAYSFCRDKGILDDACRHMIKRPSKPFGYWTKCKVLEDALNYHSRSEFYKKSSSAYYKAISGGYLDEACSHMSWISHPNDYWSLERVKDEALRFSNRTDFMRKSGSAYARCLSKDWLEDVCSHMVKSYVNQELVYAWNSLHDPSLWKIGVSSSSRLLRRVHSVEKASGFERHELLVKMVSEPRKVESCLLRLGSPVDLGKFDGSREFITLNENEASWLMSVMDQDS